MGRILLTTALLFLNQTSSRAEADRELECMWNMGTTGMSIIWLGAGVGMDVTLRSDKSFTLRPRHSDDIESIYQTAYDRWTTITGTKAHKPSRGYTNREDFQGMEYISPVVLKMRTPGKPSPSYLGPHKEIKVIVEDKLLAGKEGWMTLTTMENDVEKAYLSDYVTYYCMDK